MAGTQGTLETGWPGNIKGKEREREVRAAKYGGMMCGAMPDPVTSRDSMMELACLQGSQV